MVIHIRKCVTDSKTSVVKWKCKNDKTRPEFRGTTNCDLGPEHWQIEVQTHLSSEQLAEDLKTQKQAQFFPDFRFFFAYLHMQMQKYFAIFNFMTQYN